MHVCFVSHILEFRKYSEEGKKHQWSGSLGNVLASVLLERFRLGFLTAGWVAPGSTTSTSNFSKSNLIFPLPTKPLACPPLSSVEDHTIPPITGMLKLRTLLGLLSFHPLSDLPLASGTDCLGLNPGATT